MKESSDPALTREEVNSLERFLSQDMTFLDARRGLRLLAHIRRADEALKEIEGLSAIPVDHDLPLEHSCCAAAHHVERLAKASRLRESKEGE